MLIKKYQDENEWKDDRLGKITGSRLKDIIVKRGTKPKKGFYELIAERISIPADGENVMDRGHRLEIEALERFEKETGKTLIKDLAMWTREDDERIAFSPDGYSEDLTEVADAKCLNSASHIEALITQEVPKEYHEQVVQAFCVNDLLKTFYLVFYDPRMPRDFFYLTIPRMSVQTDVEEDLAYQRQTLAEVDAWVEKLTF